jgi:8-oxo-dGTP diphosphatase
MAELIRAAGGLLWRETAQGLEILLVHRERYDDWSLPKGKLKKGERWEAAAVREIVEETRLSVQMGEFAGMTFYHVGDQPKVVLFWNMTLSQGILEFDEGSDTPDEVDQVVWLTPGAAQARLSYPDEAALVGQEAGRLRGI